MPKLSNQEVITQDNVRIFVQFGEARPDNPVLYSGVEGQYMAIDGLSAPDSGGIEPIWVKDPRKRKSYRLVGTTIAPPDLPSASVMFYEKHGYLPRHLRKLSDCLTNFYMTHGKCTNPDDFMKGWDSYVYVLSGGRATDRDGGTRSAFGEDSALEDTVGFTFGAVYPVGKLGFGEVASEKVDREVADVVFGPAQGCAECDHGKKFVYAATKSSGAGSPGLPAELIYNLTNGSGVWYEAAINGIGANENPLKIGIVGSYLVILGDGAYYYAEINEKTGVPGSFTKVSAGFVATNDPYDMLVVSPSEIWFVGQGGYIYKSVDITAGVSVSNAGSATSNNLRRIGGYEETLVAVGDDGTVIKSINRGQTWAATTTTPADVLQVQAVAVKSSDLFFIGTGFTGHVWYTKDGGETWTEITLAETGDCNINDIVFATDEVGYIALDKQSTPTAYLYATWDGGAHWTKTAPRINNWPTFDRPNRVAIPRSDDPGFVSNTVVVGGLAGNGTDGVIYVGDVAVL